MRMTGYRLTMFDPVVIPALPGYWCAGFDEPSGGVTDATQPGDLRLMRDAIVAWIVRPAVNAPRDNDPSVFDRSELVEPDIRPVTVDGFPASNLDYIVQPDGQWCRPGDADFDDEEQARSDWLCRKRECKQAAE